MTLNPDVVRKILLFIEENADYTDKNSQVPNQHKILLQGQIVNNQYFEEYEKSDISYALELLIKEEYVSLASNATYDVNNNLIYAKINGLTWKGHEFLDNIRNDTFWFHAKQNALKVGKVSISALASGAKALAVAWMTDPNAFNNLIKGINSIHIVP